MGSWWSIMWVFSRLFTKLVLEAPVITESALEVIRRYCEDEVSDGVTAQITHESTELFALNVTFLFQSRVYLGMTTLKELIIKRPSRQFQYLHVLLDLSSHEKEKVVTFLNVIHVELSIRSPDFMFCGRGVFVSRCGPPPWLFSSVCMRKTSSGTTLRSLPWTTCSFWSTPTLLLCCLGLTKTQVRNTSLRNCQLFSLSINPSTIFLTNQLCPTCQKMLIKCLFFLLTFEKLASENLDFFFKIND